MIFVLALGLHGAVSQQAAPAPYAEDVVILGERMNTIKFDVGMKNGNFFCTIRQSSGDDDLDALYCNAQRYCSTYVTQLYVQYDEALKSRATRKAARRAIETGASQCLEQTADRMLENLAEMRWRDRQATTTESN